MDQIVTQLDGLGLNLEHMVHDIRRLDRVRLLSKVLEKCFQNHLSTNFRILMKVQLKETKAISEAQSRIKGLLLMGISNKISEKQSTEKYFYQWYVKSRPDLLERVAWNILIKERLSHKVASARLMFLAKFKTKKVKKINFVDYMESFCKLHSFVQRKAVYYKKHAMDRMNPFSHNRAYHVIKKMMKRREKSDCESKRKVLSRLSSRVNKVKQLFNVCSKKEELLKRKVYEVLKERNKNKIEAEHLLKKKSVKEKKEDRLRTLLERRDIKQKGQVIHALKKNNNNLVKRQQLIKKFAKGINSKKGNLLQKLKKLQMQQTTKEKDKQDKLDKLMKILRNKPKQLKQKALEKLRNNNFQHKNKEKLNKIMNSIDQKKKSNLDKTLKRLLNKNYIENTSDALKRLKDYKNKKNNEKFQEEQLLRRVFARSTHHVMENLQDNIASLQKNNLSQQKQDEILRHKIHILCSNLKSGDKLLKRQALAYLKDNNSYQIYKMKIMDALLAKHFDNPKSELIKAICQLREHNNKEILKMAMNSLFKWKVVNRVAQKETIRGFEEIINLNKGKILTKLFDQHQDLLKDAFHKLRKFTMGSKNSLKNVIFKISHMSSMKKVHALQELRKFNREMNEEEKLMKESLSKLVKSLNQQTKNCFDNLRNISSSKIELEKRMYVLIKNKMENSEQLLKAQAIDKLRKHKNANASKQRALSKLINKFASKSKLSSLQKWNDLVKKEKLCKFNGKITGLILSLRKNHKHEMRSAFSKWSQKDIKSKYKRMALFLQNSKEIQQKETYVHMKILYVQKKFSKMCKVLAKFLEFVENRKRENKLYAFDAMCLDNPWTEKVPKLLACSRVMSAQMCFWKLLMTKSQVIKKRKQRGGGYKIDKLKIIMLENIFTKKMSQYFMQIQLGRRNKYL